MSKIIPTLQSPPAVADEPSPSAPRPKRVLVVEGDGVTRWILLNSLRNLGLLVDFAPNGFIALYKFRRRSPDAILMDVELRGAPGPDVIKAVRKDPKFGNKPIYVFTRTAALSRALRKLVAEEATEVFDKSTTVPEKLAANIAEQLAHSDLKGAAHAGAPRGMPVGHQAGCTKDDLKAMVADFCQLERQLRQSNEAAQRNAVCRQLREKAAWIVSSAWRGKMGNLARQAEAVESLLDLVCNNPANLDETSLMAISGGAETLERLGQEPVIESPTSYAVVVVDEMTASRTAISDALADSGLGSTCFAGPAPALEYLAGNRADAVVIAGAGLAARGMDESSLRKLPLHENTPVVTIANLAALNGAPAAPFNPTDTSDAYPLALMKLVIKALQVVQLPVVPGNRSPVPASPTPEPNPATPESTNPAEPAASAAVQQVQKSVLLIEDDPIVLKAYGDRLLRAGYRVASAMDGFAALDMVLNLKPDAIVLDLMLPNLHGLEVLKFIRSHSNLNATPVIVLSNVFMGPLSVQALEAGANLGLPKTQCSPTKLIEILRMLLGRQPAAVVKAAKPNQPDGLESHGEDSALATARAELLADGPREIGKMRQDCLAYIQTAGLQESMDHLASLYRGVRFLGGRAGLAGCANLNDLTAAFEALLFEMVFRCSEPTASVLQTIAQAVECLGRLFENDRLVFSESHAKSKILVVDDDAVFNHTTTAALKRSNFNVVATQDPAEGLQLLHTHRFDLVILDINLPGMDGFAFCSELRQIPGCQATPVLFVTMNAEFENRARSLLVGNSSFIGKPISPLDLALNVTIRLLDPTTLGEAQAPAASQVEATPAPEAQADTQEAGTAHAAGTAPEALVLPASRLETASTADPDPTMPALAEFAAVAGRGLSEPESEQADTGQAPPDTREAVELSEFIAQAPCAAPDENAPEQAWLTNAEPATDQDLVGKLKKDREELVMRTYAVETELHNAKASIERRDKAIKSLQQKLEEFTAKQATGEFPVVQPGENPEQTNGCVNLADDALKEKEAQCLQLTQDLAKVREDLAKLGQEYSQEQAAARQSANRVQELENQLNQRDAALGHTKTEARQQAEDLRHQLVATTTAQQQAEGRGEQLQARCGQLEKELAALSQAREELNGRLAKEQQVASAAAKRIQELEKQQRLGETTFRSDMTEMEQRVRQAVESLARATAELEKERVERRRIEDHASSLASRLQELHEQLSRHLAEERAAQRRINELELHLQQRDEAVNRLNAQLQQKNADHQLAKEQLQEAKECEDQEQKNVILFEQARRIYKQTQQDLESKLSASVEALRESDASLQKEATERRQLASALEAAQQTLADETEKRQDFESQLAALTKRFAEIQTQLQIETGERQKLSEALETVQRNLRDQAQRDELEISKLRSALQLEEVEHKRLESRFVRLRRISLDSARSGRVYRNDVRRKVSEPVEEVCQSARHLLQLDLNPEQGQLVQKVLENALLVQANLQDAPAEPAAGDGAGDTVVATPPPPDSKLAVEN